MDKTFDAVLKDYIFLTILQFILL